MDIFALICCKNCTVCLKRPKINDIKEAEVGPFKKPPTSVQCSTPTSLSVGKHYLEKI